MTTPFDQSRYQVRLDWGVTGLDRLAPSDVVVVVDVLRFSTAVADRVAAGERVPLDAAAHAASLNGAAVAARAAGIGGTAGIAADGIAADGDRKAGARGEDDPAPAVMLGSLRNASAVAAAVLAEQHRRGARTSVAVIACGELSSRQPGAHLRHAVEDLLGAGAVIDALGALGIDHTSPEAAAACEAFRGLRGGAHHLLAASGSGQELIERGARDDVFAASQVDAVASVPLLRDGAFVAY